MAEDPPQKLRFVDSMPRPLLGVFALVAIAAVALSVWALLRPPPRAVPVSERRLAPREASHSHHAGVVQPVTDLRVDVPAPCSAVEGVRLIGGGDAATRLYRAIQDVCRLTAGVSEEVAAAVRALSRATVRFGRFELTGAESTLTRETRTIWLNAKFALRSRPVHELGPVILHEAHHLAAGGGGTAEVELAARQVELEACRNLIPIREWPRSCEDARALVGAPRASALAALRAAGYE